MPYVKTEPVESSNIERIGYNRKQSILRIVFQGGRAYDYPLVTERDFDELMAADSKGSFFNRRIKPLYPHRTPRDAELVEPCCEHAGSDTCTDECFPCNEWCCPGAGGPSPKHIKEAIADGLRFGAEDHSAPRPRTDEEKITEFAEAYGASPATVENLTSGNSGEGAQVGGDVEVGRTADCACTDAALNCNNSCECSCHEVSSVPPAVPRTADGEIDMEAIPDATSLFSDSDGDTSVEDAEKVCLHPNIEVHDNYCQACGADLSQSGDCPHGADGRVCEEGCGCIPCHANVPESPEAEAHSKVLNEAQEVIENEEEETNGSSD